MNLLLLNVDATELQVQECSDASIELQQAIAEGTTTSIACCLFVVILHPSNI